MAILYYDMVMIIIWKSQQGWKIQTDYVNLVYILVFEENRIRLRTFKNMLGLKLVYSANEEKIFTKKIIL